MELLRVLLLEADLRAFERGRLELGRLRPSGGLDVLTGELDDPLVLEVARCRDDDVGAGVAGPVIGIDVGDGDGADHLRLAEHAAAERMTAEHGGVEDVVDLVLRLVLVHGDLLEHDLALGVDLRIGRAEQHLGEEVERLIGVGVEEAGVEIR